MYRKAMVSLRARQFAAQIGVEYYCTGRDYEPAFAALREVIDLGIADLMWLDHCPLLAPLRDHEDYAALHAIVSERTARIRRALGISAA